MAKHTPRGTFYSTDDLIRMAGLGQFGTQSPLVMRALVSLKRYEIENEELRKKIADLENIDDIRETYNESNDPQTPNQQDLTDFMNDASTEY